MDYVLKKNKRTMPTQIARSVFLANVTKLYTKYNVSNNVATMAVFLFVRIVKYILEECCDKLYEYTAKSLIWHAISQLTTTV